MLCHYSWLFPLAIFGLALGISLLCSLQAVNVKKLHGFCFNTECIAYLASECLKNSFFSQNCGGKSSRTQTQRAEPTLGSLSPFGKLMLLALEHQSFMLPNAFFFSFCLGRSTFLLPPFCLPYFSSCLLHFIPSNSKP